MLYCAQLNSGEARLLEWLHQSFGSRMGDRCRGDGLDDLDGDLQRIEDVHI